MPVGVITTTSARAAATPIASGPEARWFVVGLTDRGPADTAVRVRSLAQFEAIFGGATNYSSLHEQMQAFFGEGGYEAWVARVVGPDADSASASLDTGKLVVTAKHPGSFANTWTAEYTSATKTLTVTTDSGTETYTGADLAGLLAAAAASPTVTVTSSGTLPAANVNAVTLTGGTDDRASVTATTATNALSRFDGTLGAGAVSIPGWSHAQVGSALQQHARLAPGRIIIQGVARVDTLSDANTVSDASRSSDPDGYRGLIWPWVTTPSGATISPEGAVAGLRARTVTEKGGVWVPPAGGNGAFRYITGIDQGATRDEVNTAHDEHAVNVIVMRGGPRLYGWRSGSLDEANFRYLHYRDILNTIRQNSEIALEPYVYAPLTEALRLQVKGTVISVLDPFVKGGAFYPNVDDDGNELDPGWAVFVEHEMGSNGEGYLDIQVSTRHTPAAELIRESIVKVAVGATLS